MLQLKNVEKIYVTGGVELKALNKVSISFRKNEFVSILGPSGSGKTTMLNIIGGLDRFTSGNLIINGTETDKFSDRDWDTYRNHSVGFVFQSYNLIEHQTVLSNVELALTLSGVSKSERRRRAEDALRSVGLADQMNKRPGQMSGGQMQRVAIARALVNDPDILLADEPTGALDSDTSKQIMKILKDISSDKLVIMVTHNAELADEYSTRIVRLLDGVITSDTNPLVPEAAETPRREKSKRLRSMSFFTALSLSLNNLMTKKARTFLTSFAGSIGIIGIALILSVSTGVQAYIDRVQEDTLSSYPVTISAEQIDLSSLITSLSGVEKENALPSHELDAVYESHIVYDMMNALNSADTTTNNLEKFKTFIDSDEELSRYLSAAQYTYDLDLNIYTKDLNNKIIKSDISELFTGFGRQSELAASSPFAGMSYSSYNVWQEMLKGNNGEIINPILTEQYDLVAGEWPDSYDEIVIVIDKNNELSDLVLYTLGLKSLEEMQELMKNAMTGEKIETDSSESWSYDEICSMTFKLLLKSELYSPDNAGGYFDISQSETGLELLYGSSSSGITLRVAGIIRASEDAVSSMMSGSIGYTSALTEHVISKTAASPIVDKQLTVPDTDVFTGLKFPDENSVEKTDAEKAAASREYFDSLKTSEKALVFVEISSQPSEEYLQNVASQYLATADRESITEMMISAYAEKSGSSDIETVRQYISGMTDDELFTAASAQIMSSAAEKYTAEAEAKFSVMSSETLAAMFDSSVTTDEQYAALYDGYVPSDVSDSTYEDNLKALGYIELSSPSSVSLYASTFANKDEIARVISAYNESVPDADRIEYTDYVKLIMSSVTTIIDAISYVLIAFVAISLIVSSIMIGVITYISVLERTKEIGILRAVGASKTDVSRVFNAETAIIGLTAGVIGIAGTLLLILPINLILHLLTGIEILSAQLPVLGAVILILISVVLTLISGLVPARLAARKDPVEALRSE